MQIIRRVIKVSEPGEDDDKLREKLTKAQSEHEKVKKLIDLFMLALFLIFVMYTVI